jgi:hypothetical protein
VKKSKELYCNLYNIRFSIDKKHRFGVHAKLEEIMLEFLEMVITSALVKNKSDILQQARIKIEMVQHFIRMEHDLKIISHKQYTVLSLQIEEITKMTNGWYKSTLIQK